MQQKVLVKWYQENCSVKIRYDIRNNLIVRFSIHEEEYAFTYMRLSAASSNGT